MIQLLPNRVKFFTIKGLSALEITSNGKLIDQVEENEQKKKKKMSAGLYTTICKPVRV